MTTHNSPQRRRAASTTVPINGAKVRELRIRLGREVADLAEEIRISRSYLSKIELGHSRRVSPTVFNLLMRALGVRSRHVLLNRETQPVVGAER